jgi:hypothetical protein
MILHNFVACNALVSICCRILVQHFKFYHIQHLSVVGIKAKQQQALPCTLEQQMPLLWWLFIVFLLASSCHSCTFIVTILPLHAMKWNHHKKGICWYLNKILRCLSSVITLMCCCLLNNCLFINGNDLLKIKIMILFITLSWIIEFFFLLFRVLFHHVIKNDGVKQ